MRILIAEDDATTRRLLEGLLQSWSYDVVVAKDGPCALAILQSDGAPQLALLDWMMPGLAGPDVCRALRLQATRDTTYLILLTSRNQRTDIVAGLAAGADEYLLKPFHPDELHARLKAAIRILDLQQRLAAQVAALELALGHVRQLSGLLPICSYCKAIRDDSNYWHRVEEFVSEHSSVQFSHGICPKCMETALRHAEEEG
jgi:sigma-B regulation protein RsbU (phosphoserine phosphatase)